MTNSEKYRFENISVREGLSHSDVSCAMQDKQGLIWFGTLSGVSSYDGYKFKNYSTIKNSYSHLDRNIHSCFVDSDGSLWFGSISGSLIEYDTNTDCLVKHDINLTKKFPSRLSPITSICEDSFGFLWIAVWNRGLYKFDKKTKLGMRVYYDRKSKMLNKREQIRSLIITQNNELMIALSTNVVDILNVKNETFKSISLSIDSKLNFVYRFSGDKYFVGTTSGLYEFNLVSNELIDYEIPSLKKNDIYSMCIDRNENLWLSILNEGLIQVENKTMNIKAHSSGFDNNIRSRRIHSLFIDKSNVMWICTEGSGIYKVDTIQKKFYFINKFDIDDKDIVIVWDMIINKNNLWIGTQLNNLFKYDLNNKTIKEYNTLDSRGNLINSSSVKTFFEDSKRNLWLGSSKTGLYKYKKENDAFIEFGNLSENGINKIYAISEYYQNSNHFLLIGSNKPGLACVDTETGLICEFKNFHKLYPKIKMDMIRLLYLDAENNLWIRLWNEKGVFKLSVDSSKLEHYRLNLKNDIEIFKIYSDKMNNLWFCTTNGLFKYDWNKKVIVELNQGNGLPSNRIHGLIEDRNNNFWVITPKAISKFDPIKNYFKNYSYNSGFLNEEFLGSCCIDKNGVLYFGGQNGIDYFNPDEIEDSPHIPNIVLTDFQLFNKSVKPSVKNSFLSKNIEHTREIYLTYKENIFSFEFAALIFNNPKQNQYAYMMEGFDKDWVYCGTRRTATYTNLNPGEYTFRVKGSNNDGVWNEEGTSVKITITPPYWKTWWFKGLGLLSMAAATGLTYKNRLDKIEKERKEQEEFSRKLIESQENERKRIASELHDTIAHDILVTQNKAAIGLKHIDEKEKVRSTLKEISELSSAAIKEVRNISYNLHPHQLERVGFTKTIKSIVSEVNNATGIDFEFESDLIDGHLTKESEINLFRVIQESINNMIKHSEADKAEVKLLMFENYILVVLKDNGKGISPDKKALQDTKGGFGLSGMKERIKYMKGEIHIESNENKGTSIIIRIPLKTKGV